VFFHSKTFTFNPAKFTPKKSKKLAKLVEPAGVASGSLFATLRATIVRWRRGPPKKRAGRRAAIVTGRRRGIAGGGVKAAGRVGITTGRRLPKTGTTGQMGWP